MAMEREVWTRGRASRVLAARWNLGSDRREHVDLGYALGRRCKTGPRCCRACRRDAAVRPATDAAIFDRDAVSMDTDHKPQRSRLRSNLPTERMADVGGTERSHPERRALVLHAKILHRVAGREATAGRRSARGVFMGFWEQRA